jgi:16S rRNA processing protein RimM
MTSEQQKPQDDMVTIGKIGAPVGLRGEVRLISYLQDDENWSHYKHVHTAMGDVELMQVKTQGKGLVARFRNIHSREQAQNYTHQLLQVARGQLPELDDEDSFYFIDYVGYEVFNTQGAKLGVVAGVEDFGGGELLDIELEGGKRFFAPFHNKAVPTIDEAAKTLILDEQYLSR